VWGGREKRRQTGLWKDMEVGREKTEVTALERRRQLSSVCLCFGETAADVTIIMI
jgi:hypothetical protein